MPPICIVAMLPCTSSGGGAHRPCMCAFCNEHARADHRGTPEAPGRTATVEPAEGVKCWGIAYKLPDELHERRVALQALEWREKCYDEKHTVDIHAEDGTIAVAGALMYVASPDPEKNLNYGGPRPMSELANQIALSHGPSGPNTEYLFGIADGLRSIGAEDSHVFQLEQLVQELLQSEVK